MNGQGKDWFIKTAKDADLKRPDRRLALTLDVGVCEECGKGGAHNAYAGAPFRMEAYYLCEPCMEAHAERLSEEAQR